MANTKDDLTWAATLRNDLFLFSAEVDFAECDMNDLFRLLVIADDAYHNGTSILTDEQFDSIRLFCSQAEPNNSYFLGVGSGVRGGKVKLPYLMGSLTQAYIGGEMLEWVQKHKLQETACFITEKLDGQSALIVYDQNGKLQISYSRGDGYEGADTTRHTSKIKSLPKTVSDGPMVVRAEIIFGKKNFDIVKTKTKRSGGSEYKNARNMISGIMNSSEADSVVYEYIDVVAYEVLQPTGLSKKEQLVLLNANGFKIPVRKALYGKQLDDATLIPLLSQFKATSEYEIDGVVIDVNDSALRDKINPSTNSLNPEFARKFKVQDESNLAIATVVEVQWNISKNGYLKPRVKIEPVELVGVTVKHATGFNAAFILNNGIGPGAKIRITRSGDVIPFIQGVVKAATPQMPDEEDVRWTLNKDGQKVDLVLENVSDNDTVKLEQMIDFFGKTGVEHLGEGNLKAIFDAGFTTVVDAINLSQFEWTSMIGANGKKIYASIREKLKNVPWYIVAGAHSAFGRGVGVRKMKKLYEAFEGDMTKLSSVPAILAVDGFEAKTAMKITSGFTNFIKFLTDTSATITFATYEAPKSGGLSGSTFLFTGFRSPELEAKIVEHGGKISSSVSSKLTFLVAADPSETSGKLKKAREVGTKIISREELEEML